jgi:prevent-host-death family protein
MAYNIADAKAHFSELVRRAAQGEEIVIARDNHPLVKLVPVAPAPGQRKPGSARGLILHMADDFDATPKDFAEYTAS